MASNLNNPQKKKIKFGSVIWYVHKWVALIVGIQFVLWTMSGFIMSYVPIEEVHGDHLWDKSLGSVFVNSGEVSFDLDDVTAKYDDQKIRKITLFPRNGKNAYEIRVKGRTLYVDANSGAELSPLTEQDAIDVAKKSYRWTGNYHSIEYVTDPDQYGEIRGRPLPIWKVNFDDDVATSLYVSPERARVITARSDIWRQYDFFWMLHIMDYDTRDNFNSWLLILATSMAIFVALSGFILLFYSFSKKDFRWIMK